MSLQQNCTRIIPLKATEWDRRWRATEWSEAVLCRKRRERRGTGLLEAALASTARSSSSSSSSSSSNSVNKWRCRHWNGDSNSFKWGPRNFDFLLMLKRMTLKFNCIFLKSKQGFVLIISLNVEGCLRSKP